jgi:hypothetical protein
MAAGGDGMKPHESPYKKNKRIKMTMALKSPEKKLVCVYNAILSIVLTLEK